MDQRRSAWKGVLAGLAIVVVGVALMQSDTMQQTPQTVALFSVLVAVGIGVIGGALMPDSFTVNGQDVKPLGLGGSATGGAAFFVATLVFLYATGVNRPDAHPPAPVPSIAAASPVAAPSVAPAVSAPTPSAAPSPAAAPMPSPTRAVLARPAWVPEPPVPVAYREWTYCSECCPEGPAYCRFSGWGASNNEEQAKDNAIRNCIGSGGHPGPCVANVQAY